jgi:DNA-3-methyladenine glycosylase
LTQVSAALPRAFYNRPAIEVARALLGTVLVHGTTSGRITSGRIVETEAYLGLQDRAAHSWRGITPRTRVMFGEPGHAYVYLIYGMYECLNVVAEPPGSPGCVLIRALEPLEGIPRMRRRRPAARGIEDLANGPGKLTLALGVSRRHNGADLTSSSLTIHRPSRNEEIKIGVSPRIGIKHCADWPLRFFVQGNRFVSR